MDGRGGRTSLCTPLPTKASGLLQSKLQPGQRSRPIRTLRWSNTATEGGTMPPYELESVVLHNDVLKFVDVGVGPAVVLVHGLLGSHESWTPQIAKLAKKHRVVAPDLF